MPHVLLSRNLGLLGPAAKYRSATDWTTSDQGTRHTAEDWEKREERRAYEHKAFPTDSLVYITKFDRIVTLADFHTDIALEGSKRVLNCKVSTHPRYQRNGHATEAIEFLQERTSAGRMTVFIHPDHGNRATDQFLRRHGCLGREWRRIIKPFGRGYARGYDGLEPIGLTAVEELFRGTEGDSGREQIRDGALTGLLLGSGQYLRLRPITQPDRRVVTLMRLDIANQLGYDAQFERVEHVVDLLIDGQVPTPSWLFVVEDLRRAQVVGTVRLTPRHNIEWDTTELEVRDLFLDPNYRAKSEDGQHGGHLEELDQTNGVASWIFAGLTRFGIELIDRCDELLLSALLPYEPLARHLLDVLGDDWRVSPGRYFESR